jgi:putative FmdB family regulatory protein
MPLFEYRCPDCSREFELLIRAQERPACPECNSTRVEKLLSIASAAIPGSLRLPVGSACPPGDAPPCGPGCCRMG